MWYSTFNIQIPIYAQQKYEVNDLSMMQTYYIKYSVSYLTALSSKMLNSEIIYADKRLQVSFLFNTATIMIARRGIPELPQCRLALQRRQNYYKPHYLNNEMLFTRTCNYIWFRMIMDKKIVVSCDCPKGMLVLILHYFDTSSFQRCYKI